MRKETLDIVLEGNAMKGDVLGAARLAGIMAAKNARTVSSRCVIRCRSPRSKSISIPSTRFRFPRPVDRESHREDWC